MVKSKSVKSFIRSGIRKIARKGAKSNLLFPNVVEAEEREEKREREKERTVSVV